MLLSYLRLYNNGALNYNLNADEDDGSCLYGGCTDPSALNYNFSVNIDDGTLL